MKITSSAFDEGAMIPSQYTCDGINISPPLNWSDAPEATKSFAPRIVVRSRSQLGRLQTICMKPIVKGTSRDILLRTVVSFNGYGYVH